MAIWWAPYPLGAAEVSLLVVLHRVWGSSGRKGERSRMERLGYAASREPVQRCFGSIERSCDQNAREPEPGVNPCIHTGANGAI